jgi:NADH-quinone oxidoreductase subunit J
MVEQVLFLFFSLIAVATAVFVVAARNPLHSALSLIGTFFALAGIYVLLGAHLLAAIQVLVYAGAVMVLFVFVIMLLNLKDEELGAPKPTIMKALGGLGVAVTTVGLIGKVFWDLRQTAPAGAIQAASELDLAQHADFGTVAAVGRAIYGPYMLPFEVTSLLLLVAIVAAVVIAKAKI